MIAVLNIGGEEYKMAVPNKTITRIIQCPKKLLDTLPLCEIEAYVAGRKEREA
jgi:hypothetical protein